MIAIVAAILFVSIGSPIAHTNYTYGQQESFLTYINKDFGVSMQYPIDWTKTEDNLQNNYIVMFESPVNTGKFNFTDPTTVSTPEANIGISVFPEEENKTFSEFTNDTITSWKQDKSIKVINYSDNYQADKRPALKITYYLFGQQNIFGLGGSTTQKALAVFVLDPDKDISYLIKYLSQPSKYDVYLPVAQKMIDSFKVSLVDGGGGGGILGI
jgi:PsbP-like protein